MGVVEGLEGQGSSDHGVHPGDLNQKVWALRGSCRRLAGSVRLFGAIPALDEGLPGASAPESDQDKSLYKNLMLFVVPVALEAPCCDL